MLYRVFRPSVDNFVHNPRTTRAVVDNFRAETKRRVFLHTHSQVIHSLSERLSNKLSTPYFVDFKRVFMVTHRLIHSLLTTTST